MVDTDTRESEESVLSKQSLGMMHQSEGEKTEEDEGRIVNSSTNSSIPTCNIPMDGASDTSSSALPAIMQDANDRQAAFSTEMAAITNQSVDSGDDDTGDDSDSSNYVEIGFGGDYTASKVTFMTGGSSLPQSLPLPPSRAASTVSNISSSDIPTTSTNTAAPTGSNNLSYRRGSSNINNGMDAYQQQQQQQHWVVDWTEMMGAMDTAFQENVAIPTRSAVRKIFYTTTGNAGSASAAPPNVSATTSSLPVATAATTKKRGRCYNHLTNNGASIVSNSHVYNDDRRKNDNDTSNNKSPYVIATDHEEEYKQTNDNDHDQENEEDEEAIAMKKRHVEKFWKFYDDVISVSLGSLLGILARILAARFFTYVDMGTVFVDGSVLFTNLPLNCLSTFLLGLFGSGHDCLKVSDLYVCVEY